MTFQASAWAIEQPVPGTAKLVLLALANHADHTNGYVHFDAPTISREASIEVPSLWRYLGALERNGYVAKDEHKAGAERRQYWLILDRDVTRPWAWSADDDAGDDAAASPIASAPSDSPKSFRRADQDRAREVAAEPSAAQALGVPVIERSKAFIEWCDHYRNVLRRPPPFVHAIKTADGKDARGFYMPTLFPLADDKIENLDGAA